jgi:hypothetical protein
MGITATPNSGPLATKQAMVMTDQADTSPHGTPPPPTTPKPIPGALSASPEPTGFPPFPENTPAGMGAIALIQPPFSGLQYHIANTWYEDMDGGRKRLYVYAGDVSGHGGESTEQGVLVIEVLQKTMQNGRLLINKIESDTYLTAVQAGSVRITDAVGERLILQSTGGATFYFDVPTRQYLPSLAVTVTMPPSTTSPETPAPSATPLPR